MKRAPLSQLISLAMSGLAVVLAGFALFEIKAATKSAEHAVQISEQVVADLARVKPWALSRDSLVEVLKVTGLLVAEGEAIQSRADVLAPVDFKDRRYGDEDAQFTLIEYSDFECPACKAFYEVPKAIVDGSKGNVSLVFKHVPVHGEASRNAALATECAAHQGGNDAFFKMAAQIFDETESSGNGTTASMASIGRRIGLDGRELNKCIDQNLFYEKVKADFLEAVNHGIKVTPTTTIRFNPTGESVDVTGAVSAEDILKAMSQLVQKVQDK